MAVKTQTKTASESPETLHELTFWTCFLYILWLRKGTKHVHTVKMPFLHIIWRASICNHQKWAQKIESSWLVSPYWTKLPSLLSFYWDWIIIWEIVRKEERYPYNPYIYYACRMINYVSMCSFFRTTAIEYIHYYYLLTVQIKEDFIAPCLSAPSLLPLATFFSLFLLHIIQVLRLFFPVPL